jgi:hypothetical protein
MRRARHTRRPRRLVSIAFALGVALAVLGAPAPAAAHHRANYSSLEHFALHLTNCLRTGGYVTARGRCKGYGSGRYSSYRKPLMFSSRIATQVARPWARRMARADICAHGWGRMDYDVRFRAAGFRRYNGESLACSGGYSTRQMVIRGHRWFQSEKAYNGWHWINLKNRRFDRVGIGIARSGGESRVVFDFYV